MSNGAAYVLARMAARERDIVVGEKVFGWEYGKAWRTEGPVMISPDARFLMCPNFSTDIADAWLVVEAMHAQGWHFDLDKRAEASDPWCACFSRGAQGDAHTTACRDAATAPLSICLAALKAVAESGAVAQEPT